MKYEQSVQVELQEYICMVKRIDGVVAQKALEQELIRCKDCKYAYKSFNSYTCQRVFHPFTIEEDGFCSWAEEREEE